LLNQAGRNRNRDLQVCCPKLRWGPSVAQQSDRNPKSGLPNLPRTVEDAILVTLNLEYNYLWVDRYCINQHGDDEKVMQINQMDLIYQGAEVTIFDTAGDDPTLGLAGVTAFQPRVGPVQAKIGGLTLGAIVYDINNSAMIRMSTWNSRGWTYQEAIFSRRRLFFTEAGVIFDCPVMKCHETLTFPIHSEINREFGYPPCGIPQNPFRIIGRVAEYSGRKPTYSNDKLNAFKGVLNAYERLEHPIRHHWGVPIFPRDANSKVDGNECTCVGFVVGLCWQYYPPGQGVEYKRLPEFPSWSWCGWDGKVDVAVWENQGSEDESDVKIGVELIDGRVVDWNVFGCDEFHDENSDSWAASSYLLVDAWTIPVDLRYYPQRVSSTWGVHAIVGDGLEARLFNYQLSIPSSNPTAAEFEVFESRTYIRIDPGAVGTIDPSDSLFVLVVEEKEGCFERVGSFFLGEKAYPIPGRTGHGDQGWDIDCLSWERRVIRLA
jgi:hypothetical protein